MKSERINAQGITIRPATNEEWDEAIHLIWKTFVRYDAKDYPQNGIDSFAEFITDETLHRMFVVGAYEMFLAIIEQTIIGVVTLRDQTHISLLFVDGEYQHKGVGSMLVDYVYEYVQYAYQSTQLTVNAAFSATEFYEQYGFTHVREAFVQKGIFVAPMCYFGVAKEKRKIE